MGDRHAFVMMIQKKWWLGFCQSRQGEQTHSYVQRGLAPPKEGSLILFYVTKPIGEMAGYAEFVGRKTGKAEEMWKKYGRESVLGSEEQYRQFIGDKQKVSFIRFRNLQEASRPVPLREILMLFGVKRLSRKGFYVNKKTAETLLSLMEQ